MTTGRRVAVLLACVVVALLTAWYAGSVRPGGPAVPDVGSVRLGPDPGEPVDDYLAGLSAQLPPPGVVTLALVQFADERTAPDALATTAGARPVTAVFRVPLPRVQTALRFARLASDGAPAAALDIGRQQARQAALADAARLTGRSRDAAAAEAAALADPTGRDVLALVVRADRAGLLALADRPGVRAVQAAPPDALPGELALSPLLPEQVRTADPPPDDGPIPAS